MDHKTDSIMTYLLYFSLIIVLGFVFIQNLQNPWLILFLSGLVIVSITLRNAVIYPINKYNFLGKGMVLTDILLIFLINLTDQGFSSGIYYFILIAESSIAYSPLFSGLVTATCFILYHLSRYFVQGQPSLLSVLPQFGLNSLAFVGIYVIMYLVKYQIKQRRKLSEIMYELKVKTKQLENTYLKLKDASEELEELTIIKERNRIARDIHDTVGHTLTTVLLEMEAGERLIPVSPETAIEKIRLAKGQVRKGLQDIRESVKTLQSGKELMDFQSSLKLLIDETTRHGEIVIKYQISELPELNSAQEKVLYRALQEGLTNGIRHGNSTAFVFLLSYSDGNIEFMLQDNGSGAETPVKGFGLTAMEERVKEIGGMLSLHSKPQEGFQISITIPVGREETHE